MDETFEYVNLMASITRLFQTKLKTKNRNKLHQSNKIEQ